MAVKKNHARHLRKKMREMKLSAPRAYESRGRKRNKAVRRRRRHWGSDLWNTIRYRYDGTMKG
jgi:hypothetical protein